MDLELATDYIILLLVSGRKHFSVVVGNESAGCLPLPIIPSVTSRIGCILPGIVGKRK